ncbi:hypothetical protein K2173_010309 [Erythroxylum novogranatense]|uniref:NAB domain-containing protein n=1 Tax=Erythroxylum novogranatense TaxID=1862640 RepID=A0AAV8TF00_9ROSI|nr:hypothetical protein K2173_010309 [Erythroxylum novogranatense]
MEPTDSKTSSQDFENLKANKQEIEHKVAKILKLIKNNGQDKKGKIPEDSYKKAELVQLVEDFHEQYQSLLAQYDHLKREIGKRASGRKAKESPSSSSSSDLDYYSSEDIDNVLSVNEQNDGVSNSKEELEAMNLQAEGIKHKLPTTIHGRPPLHEKQEAMSPRKAQKKKADERKGEHSALVKVHGAVGTQASAQIKELEGKLTVMKIEMESLYSQRKELEAQIEDKATEAKQLREKNEQLNAKLELVSKEKHEAARMLQNLEDKDKNMTSRIESLMEQVSKLQMEVDCLRAQKGKTERGKRIDGSGQVKNLKDRINGMQQELDSLRGKKTDLELQLEMKTKEVGESQILINMLKDEIAEKVAFEQGLLREKEGFLAQVEDLHSAENQKRKLEELLRNKSLETDQLRDENKGLYARMSELEGTIADRCEALATLQKKHRDTQNKASSEIAALKSKVSNLEKEIESLVTERSELEMQYERTKLDSAENQMQVETKITNLNSKIEDQQKVMREQEDTIKKFAEEHRLVKHHSLDSPKSWSPESTQVNRPVDLPRLNHHILQRKVEELAESFQMKMENHIRLLSRRIVVAEKIHYETKDGYKKIKDKLEQENKELQEKSATFEAQVRKVKDVLLQSENNAFTVLDTLQRKLEDYNANILSRISRTSNELQFAKNWITGTRNEIEQLKQNAENLTVELHDKRKKELMLTEKMLKLEAKLRKDGKSTVVSEFERKVKNLEGQLKEKDEILMGLCQEKREAIRQLCMLIDYHCSRYDHLKQAISEMTSRTRRTT